MTLTNELRFVERSQPVGDPKDGIGRLVRILQQKVQVSYTKNFNGQYLQYHLDEWRDVPCVKEDV